MRFPRILQLSRGLRPEAFGQSTNHMSALACCELLRLPRLHPEVSVAHVCSETVAIILWMVLVQGAVNYRKPHINQSA